MSTNSHLSFSSASSLLKIPFFEKVWCKAKLTSAKSRFQTVSGAVHAHVDGVEIGAEGDKDCVRTLGRPQPLNSRLLIRLKAGKFKLESAATWTWHNPKDFYLRSLSPLPPHHKKWGLWRRMGDSGSWKARKKQTFTGGGGGTDCSKMNVRSLRTDLTWGL